MTMFKNEIILQVHLSTRSKTSMYQRDGFKYDIGCLVDFCTLQAWPHWLIPIQEGSCNLDIPANGCGIWLLEQYQDSRVPCPVGPDYSCQIMDKSMHCYFVGALQFAGDACNLA